MVGWEVVGVAGGPAGAPVEAALLDVLDDAVGHEVPDRHAATHPGAAVAGADRQRGDLHQQRPDAELFFITGADALAQIVSWRENQQLFDLAHFIGVTRPGFHLADSHLPEGVVSLVEVPAMAISSTDCRDRVGRGMPVWYLVPDGVVQYIEKRALYREAPRRPVADLTRHTDPHPSTDHLQEVPR